jgi:two-component system cell cycle sensor histidine kinase/response regulator CckA
MTKKVAKSASGSAEQQIDLRTLLLAQKTELIGELAGAMANQFNNIMMAVTSYAELELKEAAPKQVRGLQQILSNAARATSLMQKLLALSRKQERSPQPLYLNNVITEISELLQQLVGEEVEVVLDLDPNVQRVEADHVELEYLVLSLGVNARSAMVKGGKLTVSTELVELDKGFVGTSEGLGPGKYVMLAVNDTGTGVGRRADNFEPTGSSDQNVRINLALAVVRGIVKKSQGLVRVSSEPQKSTSFKIYFPALGKDSPQVQERISTKSALAAKTILVVEDDEAVRVPAAEFLKMEGFKVLQARTGPEAIHVVLRNRSPLDVLVTDIVMPGMGGRELAEKLLEMHPDLQVLYMSGDADQAVFSDATKGAQNAILQKPFPLNKLKDKIDALLGQ